MTDNPFADAFPLVVSRRIYDLAVAEGVDPGSLRPIDPIDRLYGPPQSETMWDDPDEAAADYSAAAAPSEGEEFVIEEWTVVPPRRHLDNAMPVKWLLEELLERVADEGEVTLERDHWFDVGDPNLLAAVDALYDRIAAAVTWRQADDRVANWVYRQPPADVDDDTPILVRRETCEP